LRQHLTEHTVRTAFEQGWSELGNGDLLAAAAANGFGVFVTMDRNLRYQQNLSRQAIAIVVVLNAQWPRLERHASLIAAAVSGVVAGAYLEVECPEE
jgi:hypothetical protein